MKGLKEGQVVTIIFLDHSMGDKEVKPVKATIYGKIDYISDTYIRLNFWDSDSSYPEEFESLCVLISCISSVTVWLEGIHLENT